MTRYDTILSLDFESDIIQHLNSDGLESEWSTIQFKSPNHLSLQNSPKRMSVGPLKGYLQKKKMLMSMVKCIKKEKYR